MANGIVRAIRGVVLDVEFPTEAVPEIYEALTMDGPDGNKLTLEVQQHLEQIAAQVLYALVAAHRSCL